MIAWTTRGTTLAPDSAVELHLEEKFNVDLRPWYDIDVYDSESIRVRLATGDVPVYLGGFNPAYVDLGIVRELPPDLIRTHMPGYMRWADHYLGDEVWRRTVVDGVNYAVPTALSMASTGLVMGFRDDWMQNLGAGAGHRLLRRSRQPRRDRAAAAGVPQRGSGRQRAPC